jgi:hypothetical protein
VEIVEAHRKGSGGMLKQRDEEYWREMRAQHPELKEQRLRWCP